MIKILFICHGNICRSTMAEFVMKELVRRAGREAEFFIGSAATSREELGNDIHSGTKRKLRDMDVPFCSRRAVQVTADDYVKYDMLVVMDRNNLHNLERIIGCDIDGKVRTLLSFAGEERDIADPWYTGNFDCTYDDVLKGCSALLTSL